MIRSKSGLLSFSGAVEMCVRQIARRLGISVDDLLERMETRTKRQV